MAIVFAWWLMYLFACGVGFLGVLYIYLTIKFTYWKERGIPYIKSSFPFGNIGDVLCMRKQIGDVFTDMYTRLEGHKFGGVFQLHRPTLVLRDPEIIKNFLVKDFAHFHDRGIYLDEENDPIAAHLFLLSGHKWRNLRAKLTPTFTSGKLKMMSQTIFDCGLELKDHVKPLASRRATVEVKDLVARYSTDVISSCAFGIKSNTLQNPDAEIRARGREFFDPNIKVSFGFFLNVMAPTLAAITKLGRTPQRVTDFFMTMVKDTVSYREKNNVTRPDFMQLMIQLKNKGYLDVDTDSGSTANNAETQLDNIKKLTVEEVAAQAFVFFLGGFETSSTTVSFCLYELALNPDIQTRMRQEMDEVLTQHGGQITYDAVQEMEYLDRVIAETLRKYPPVPILNRECTTDYRVPGSDVVIEKGTQVVVPVLALHHDPQYYPEPQRFDPERFTAEEKAKRNNYVYLPFGEGPRICIGMRFGLIQTKVALISLLSSSEFMVSEKTPVPPVLNPKSFILTPKEGMLLQIVNRTD